LDLKDLEIYELKIQSAEKDAQISKLTVQVETQDAQIEELSSQSSEKDMIISGLLHNNTELSSELSDLEAEINEFEYKLINLQEYVENGDFSSNLRSWETNHYSRVEDNWGITVVQVDGSFTEVLDFFRSNSRGEVGFVSVRQKLGLDVSKNSLVTIDGAVKLVSYTPGDGELVNGDYNDGAEYPVYIKLFYEDKESNTHVWSWGFLTDKAPDGKKNYYVVNEDEWYSFTSQNLMELDPEPKVITDIFVGGAGWDFHGRVDRINLHTK
jgi:hypothetical protein